MNLVPPIGRGWPLSLFRGDHFIPREGVIIECSQNDLFYNACDVILTSQMAISETVKNVDNIVNIIQLLNWS